MRGGIKKKTYPLEMSLDFHTELKAAADAKNCTLQEYIFTAISDKMEKDKKERKENSMKWGEKRKKEEE